MDNELKLPFYVRVSLLLIGVYAFVSILFIIQSIIVPIIFATIIAIILYPFVNFLVRKKLNRVLAIIISLILATLIFALLGTFLISQASRFSETWPKFVDKYTELLSKSTAWVSEYYEINPKKIIAWLAKTKSELFNTSGAAIGHTLFSVGSSLVLLFLIPVYVFMIFFYQPILVGFIHRSFEKSNHSEVTEVITQIKTLIQRYLLGLLIETAIIATLFSVGLLALGIEYAIILGVIGALLNLIPYIGAAIAALMPMMIALVTKSSPWFVLLVLGLYIVVQFVDNNFIIPKIVASKVKINALATIIVVISFGALWGIPGMFLSIPLTAIAKLIFDHIESLKPLGFLLSDNMPAPYKIKLKKADIKDLVSKTLGIKK